MEKYNPHKDTPTALQLELVPLNEYLEKNTTYTQKAHTHNFYQIIWFAKGKGIHYVDFKEYEVSPHQLFFIGKGQIHAFDNQPYEGFVIHFNKIFLADEVDTLDIFLKHNIFDTFSQKPYLSLAPEEVPKWHQLIDKMQEELENSEAFAHTDYLKNLLHLLLIKIQRFLLKEDRKQLSINDPKHLLFIRFCEAVEQHFKTLHTVKEYAKLLHISTKNLTNCTNELIQQTPLALINERLSLEAKRLLTYTDDSVSKIAYTLGFENSSNFIRFFKRLNGIAPSFFKKIIV